MSHPGFVAWELDEFEIFHVFNLFVFNCGGASEVAQEMHSPTVPEPLKQIQHFLDKTICTDPKLFMKRSVIFTAFFLF